MNAQSHGIQENRMRLELEKMKLQLKQQQEQLEIAEREKSKLYKDLRASEEQREVLQATVKSHKEDFEHERRDRERAQSRLNDVEMELVALKRQQHQNSLAQMQDYSQRRKAALEFHKEEYYRKNPNAPQHLDLVADGDEDMIDSGLGMMRSLSDESDCIPDTHRLSKLANGNTARPNGHGLNGVSRSARFEYDGYDDIDGGSNANRVGEEEGLEEDPNGGFECDVCKRRFGPTGYVMHVASCTGK